MDVDTSAAAAATSAATHDAHADEASQLLDLPDVALINVLGRLRDPLPLAFSCRHLCSLLSSPALHLAWLVHHGSVVQPHRAPAGRLLTFRPLKGASGRTLASLMLHYSKALGDQPEMVATAKTAGRAGQVGHICLFFKPLTRSFRRSSDSMSLSHPRCSLGTPGCFAVAPGNPCGK